MDDDKPILEQTTDAISSAAEATKEAVKTVAKKVRRQSLRSKARRLLFWDESLCHANARRLTRNTAAAQATMPAIAMPSSRSPNRT
jgi:hypothetical protein